MARAVATSRRAGQQRRDHDRRQRHGPQPIRRASRLVALRSFGRSIDRCGRGRSGPPELVRRHLREIAAGTRIVCMRGRGGRAVAGLTARPNWTRTRPKGARGGKVFTAEPLRTTSGRVLPSWTRLPIDATGILPFPSQVQHHDPVSLTCRARWPITSAEHQTSDRHAGTVARLSHRRPDLDGVGAARPRCCWPTRAPM